MTKKTSLVWQNCSEAQLIQHIETWVNSLDSGHRDLKDCVVFLEGEMGAGKSTFVRAVLSVISPVSRSQGSPTFPILTTYTSRGGQTIYHLDLYRLKSEDELTHSGIEDQIEEPGAIVFIEWASLFPGAFEHFKRGRKRMYSVKIEPGETPDSRTYVVD